MGEDSEMTCTFDFGALGSVPEYTTWTSENFEKLIKDQEYVIINNDTVSGQISTTLKLADIESLDFAGRYTCIFRYSVEEIYQTDIEFNVRGLWISVPTITLHDMILIGVGFGLG